MIMYELKADYDSRKQFYGKANVLIEGDRKTLKSYNTNVAYIENGVPFVEGTYSQTTLRHIKEFLKQHGFDAENNVQIMKDYGKQNGR